MGEITDALRRARGEQAHDHAAPHGSTRSPVAPSTEPPQWTAPVGRAPEEEPQAEVAVPSERRGFWQARATRVDGVGPLAERWRQIALQVRRALDRRSQRSVLVSSSLGEEGKTVTACNLALALATVAAGRRVALVDLDLRRPGVARGLGLDPRDGIEEVLAGRISLARACIPTDVADLDVYPVLSPVADAHRLLSGDRLAEVLAELQRSYALVVCDTPPVLHVPDVSLIAPHVGACLLVTRSGTTRKKVFEQTLALLPEGKVLGTLLNDVKESRRDRYDYDGYRPRTRNE